MRGCLVHQKQEQGLHLQGELEGLEMIAFCFSKFESMRVGGIVSKSLVHLCGNLFTFLSLYLGWQRSLLLVLSASSLLLGLILLLLSADASEGPRIPTLRPHSNDRQPALSLTKSA